MIIFQAMFYPSIGTSYTLILSRYLILTIGYIHHPYQFWGLGAS